MPLSAGVKMAAFNIGLERKATRNSSETNFALNTANRTDAQNRCSIQVKGVVINAKRELKEKPQMHIFTIAPSTRFSLAFDFVGMKKLG